MNRDYLLSSYQFDLPQSLVAQRPDQSGRSQCKMLVYDEESDSIEHVHFKDLPSILTEHDQLIVNDSKVFPCRYFGKKTTGGKCEIFLLENNPDTEGNFKALIKASRKNIGDQIVLSENLRAKIIDKNEKGEFKVSFEGQEVDSELERLAHIPLPPYIRDGISDEKDKNDYQTVYANSIGSVAAPTAGLHFDDAVINNLKNKQIYLHPLTLHVGLGTFKPIDCENILDHKMHREYFSVPKDTQTIIDKNYGNLIAVGTTALRVLESYRDVLNFEANTRYGTEIFLYPGKKIQSIKGLITNFHLPGSSLIVLVSAMIGREKTLELYQKAIEKKYKFYSYGDCMLILKKRNL